jgi:hypothetical protein
MSFLKAAGITASVLSLGILTACGGGGSSSASYPDDGVIVVKSGTSSTPAGSYRIVPAQSDAGTQSYSGGVVEWAYTDAGNFGVEVAFVQGNTSKYVVLFEDASDDYSCRSSSVTNEEVALLSNGNMATLPVCSSTLQIDGSAHRVKASNFTIKGLDNTSNSVTLSANVSWTLPV